MVTDYIGPIVNQVARLQHLAQPGEVLVNKRTALNCKFDWFSFIDVTDNLKNEIGELKGIPKSELNVFKTKHKCFSDRWENFCKP